MIDSSFSQYFESIYKERWPQLLDALTCKEKQVCFSPFENKIESYLKHPDEFVFNDPEKAQMRNAAGNLRNYILDPASLAPALTLDLTPDARVLDLCAAPGGKSLALLSQLGDSGSLLSNDSSPERSRRLKKVLSQYAPPEFQPRFKVTVKDGTKFGFFFQDEFSHLLVDVPCSSERHMIHQERTQEWTLKKSKFLSVKQYTLLCAALLCAQAGARIVYSTCSINPIENDDVIRKFLKKKGKSAALDEMNLEYLGAEKTEFGSIILPDRCGFGPIYLSSLRIND